MKRWLVVCLFVFSWLLESPASGEVRIPPLGGEFAEERIIAIALFNETSVNRENVLEKYPSLRVRKVFSHALNGISIEGRRKDVEQLKKDSRIASVTESTLYQADIDNSVPFIGGDAIRGLFNKKNERLTGRGVKVGIIDTGIDYQHRDLRRSYKGGYDIVDHDSDPMETKGKNKTLHGTHVAGIIAANGKLRGVAPEAEIYAYRALGPGGSGTTEKVLQAIEMAIKDKVDVLNLSLGNSVNGPDLPISLALDRAVALGITCVASNGNSGPDMWTVGSPGTSSRAISVGASTPPAKKPYITTGLGGGRKSIPIYPISGSKPWLANYSGRLIDGDIGLPGQLKKAKNKIVLVKRGRISFAEKIANAAKAGASAVLIYNNTKGSFYGKVEEKGEIPAATLSGEEGEQLKKTKPFYIHTVMKAEKELIADFSSRGPVTSNWMIKPDIVAPGVGINSTIPSGYLSLNGTSMAAPHISGACALLKQAHPEWTPEQVKSALMTTGIQLKNKQNQQYHTYEQGAGRVQLQQAVKADTFFYPSSLTFRNDHKKKTLSASIIVENTGIAAKHYRFTQPGHQPGIVWKMPFSFTLQAKEKKKLTIELSHDTRKRKTSIYDGRLTILEGTKKIHLPYLYAINEPQYPRVMGFEFVPGDSKSNYRYELYLPGGAEEMGIALYEKESYRFAGFLDWSANAPRGLIRKEIRKEKLPPNGAYIAIIYAKKAGREDRIERTILIDLNK
ncbi:minor extracellular serine protease Vpr [Peribacillus deserti]|uniref:Minor extracellular serine protease Vpr n=1 Tax=Peribacillus deserti TaxID=673318 RepID=A0ABS2QDC6_9BACI|nr:S8 family serine peptidase [Peribacillus deserti]MBM7690679.1 minor extracellular serine protease Vpr [Peribacillus deserti]